MPGRQLEPGIYTDIDRKHSYARYLRLDTILDAQQPLSDPPHHDEMLFIIQHQIAELWFKLVIHEIRATMQAFRDDALHRASKNLLRIKRIQHQMFNQWAVLDTLTPSEYSEFRHVFGNASGLQSPQYRLLEFLLGNRDSEMLKLHRQDEQWYPQLVAAISSPAIFDEFLMLLCRNGFEIPQLCFGRDFSRPRDIDPDVIAALKLIYENTEKYWGEYETCETLLDVANNFQFWRFRHLKSVERIIGHKRGTGGSSGVRFLRQAMEQEFFPELIQVRTEIG